MDAADPRFVLAAQHARLMKRRGMGLAQVAVARTILVSAFWMLKRDEPYHDLGVDWHTAATIKPTPDDWSHSSNASATR